MALLAHPNLKSRWASSFRHRDFRLLWGATVLHAVGSGMERVSLGWLVFDMTDSAFMVGISAAATTAPFFFLGIVSGAIADWADRRLIIRLVAVGSGLVAVLMALVLLTDVVRVWHVMALAVATGSAWALILTVWQAYTYDIVGPDRALNGMALNSVAMSLGGIVGSIAGGALIALIGVGPQYLVVAAIYGLAALVLMGTRSVGQAAVRERGSVLQNLVGYVELLRTNRTLMTLMLFTAAIEVLGFTHHTLLPVMAKEVLGVGSTGLGAMVAVSQLGGMIGVMLLASLEDFRRKGLLLLGIAEAFGFGLMGLSLVTNMLLFLAALAFVNACAMIADTLNRTLMQSNVSNEQRGRAMGSWVLSIGTAPPGHIGIGALAGVVGAKGALLVNGGALVIVGIGSAMGLPKIRRLK